MEDKREREMGNGKNDNILRVLLQPDANEEKERENELEPVAGTPEAHGRNTPVLTRLEDLSETLLLFQYSDSLMSQ